MVNYYQKTINNRFKLKILKIPKDGNCLFGAIIEQLMGEPT